MNKLTANGELLFDNKGLPIPTYNQEAVIGVAQALTGWNLDMWNSDPLQSLYLSPMVQFKEEDRHFKGSKVIFDEIKIPEGQSAEKDLSDLLDHIINHQNTAPFVSTRLIQRLVTSNPSSDYDGRVAKSI